MSRVCLRAVFTTNAHVSAAVSRVSLRAVFRSTYTCQRPAVSLVSLRAVFTANEHVSAAVSHVGLRAVFTTKIHVATVGCHVFT